MRHRFDISADGGDMLVLVYQPTAIRELVKLLDDLEAADKLPEYMQTPVRGVFCLSKEGTGPFCDEARAMVMGPASDEPEVSLEPAS